jgi:hypothetical protein
MSDTCITPVGRFVSGSITEKRTVDHQNRPLTEDKYHFAFGVAFPKTDPAMVPVFGYLQAAARAGIHNGLPAVENFDLNGYSWKVKDGDAPNARGERNANTAGCYVFYFSSMYPVNCCDQTNATVPADAVYRGCYVDMVIDAKSNDLRDKPGIYLNPNWMRFIANGEKITGGVDAKTAFGGHTPAALPPGASASPVPSSAPSAAMTGPAPARDFVQNATGAAPATQTMPGLPGMPS